MRTLKLTLQYIGTQYCGWQIQPNGLTIQEVLQDVLSKTLQEEVKVMGSGRTDSGVHALAQVAHFRTHHTIDCQLLAKALNGQLPDDIAVSTVTEVGPDFHAMKSASAKTYSYFILNSPKKYPFLTPYTWRQFGKWQLGAIAECLAHIEGRHDFRAFCAADSMAKTTERNLLAARHNMLKLSHLGQQLAGLFGISELLSPQVNSSGPEVLAFSFRGEGFLKHMVRNLMGTLRDVGLGKTSVAEFIRIMESKDRRQAGITAPPQGLFLVEVEYCS